MNEKRATLRSIEEKCGIELILVPNENIETPEFSIRRVRAEELGLAENTQSSYQMPTAPPELTDLAAARAKARAPEAAVVAPIMPTTSAPVAPAPQPVSTAPAVATHSERHTDGGSFWARVKRLLGAEPEIAATAPAPVAPAQQQRAPARDGRHSRSMGEGGGRSGADRGPRRDGPGRHRGERGGRGRSRPPGQGQGDSPREGNGPREGNSPRDGNRQAGANLDRDRPRAPNNDGALAPAPLGGEGPEREPRVDGERRPRRSRRRRRGGGGGGGVAREGAPQNGVTDLPLESVPTLQPAEGGEAERRG